MEPVRKRIDMKQAAWILILLWSAWGCVPAEPSAESAPARSAQAASQESFYFVQITDSHWGARDGLALTRKAVEMINALPVKVEFVAFTGDIFSDSIRKDDVLAEGLAIMKGLKPPVYYVPGNHDVVKGDRAATEARFERQLGPLNRSVRTGGVRCLFLCTEMAEGSSRDPGEVEREWLGKSLKGESLPTLVFMHRPPLHDLVSGSDGAVSWDDEYDVRWKAFFGSHPEIKAVLAGHFHRDVTGWIGDMPVYVAPALARFWDRQPSFRLYRFRDGHVNYWTLYPERPAAHSQASRPAP